MILIGSTEAYGNGCYQRSRTFAELFPAAEPALDLGAGITMTPDVPGTPSSYTVSAGAGVFVVPTGTQLLSNAATPGVLGGSTTLSTTQINPGLDLVSIGMPGCNAYLNLSDAVGVLLTGTPTATLPVAIPSNASLAGMDFFVQSGANDPAMTNPFGAITSNGVKLTVGTIN